MTAAPDGRALLSRQSLLDAAAAALVEGGGAMEVQDVARRAGVSVGLAYHRFGSKAGLMAAVVEGFYDALQGAIALEPREFPDWGARERERTRRMVRFLSAEPLAPIVLVRLAREPEVAAVDAERWAGMIGEGARNIAQGQRQGAIPKGRKPALLAALVLGAVRHAVAQAAHAEPPPDPDALADEIWTFLADGLRLSAGRGG